MKTKNKLLKICLLMFSVFAILIPNVNAEEAVEGKIKMDTHGNATALYSDYFGSTQRYSYWNFTVTINNEDLKGYCVDAEYHFDDNETYAANCQKIDLETHPMFKYIKENENTIPEAEFSLLTRLIGQYYDDLHKDVIENTMSEWINQLAQNCYILTPELMKEFSGDTSIIENAVSYAREAYEKYESNNSNECKTKLAESGEAVTENLTSNEIQNFVDTVQNYDECKGNYSSYCIDKKLKAAKTKFPEGTPWGYEQSYFRRLSAPNVSIYGSNCGAYAYTLSDALFDNLPATVYINKEFEKYENKSLLVLDGYEWTDETPSIKDYTLKKGDLISLYYTVTNSYHIAVVTSNESNGCVNVTEGNMVSSYFSTENGIVEWDNKYCKSDSTKVWIEYITRYPTDSSLLKDPTNKVSTDIPIEASGANDTVDEDAADEDSDEEEEEDEVEEPLEIEFKLRDSSSCGNVIYDVTSNYSLKEVEFLIESGGTIVGYTWDDKAGTVTVNLDMTSDSCNKKIKILMNYKFANEEEEEALKNSSLYICDTGNSTYQNILAMTDPSADDDDSPDTFEFEDSYPSNCVPNGCEKCCSTGIDSTKYKQDDIHNCCYEKTESNLREWDLNDIFCDRNSDGLSVAHSLIKCGGEVYQDQDFAEDIKVDGIDNKYCNMYCTERVKVTTPSATQTISGRYFTLNTFEITLSDPDNRTVLSESPYVEEVRRCRIIINYDVWNDDYTQIVKEEVEAFNQYQLAAARAKAYEDAVSKATQKTGTYSVWCDNNGDGDYEDAGDTSNSYTYTYTSYNFTDVNYLTVKMDESFNNKTDGWKIIYDKTKTYKHGSSVADATEISNIQSTIGGNCTDSGFPETEDVTGNLAEYQKLREDYKLTYESLVATADNYESELDKCDDFFTDFDSSKLDKYYDTTGMELQYSYEQVVLNAEGQAEIVMEYDGFDPRYGERACYVKFYNYDTMGSSDVLDSNDINADIYSTTGYKNGETTSNSFNTNEIELISKEKELAQYLRNDESEKYKADNKFTTDGAFVAQCSWVRPASNKYTLYPSGLVVTDEIEQYSDYNYTTHLYESYVKLQTLKGAYQTYWKLTGIGHGGRLDSAFENGKTCTNEDVEDLKVRGQKYYNTDIIAQFTCAIVVENQLVKVGSCENGAFLQDDSGEVVTITNNPTTCEVFKDEDKYNFDFKFVDTEDMFPNGTTDDNGEEYAKNWTAFTEGATVSEELKNNADSTFAPENKTYSVTLSTSDLRAIKTYNENVESTAGYGYNDFDLQCTCKDNHALYCNECKSTFMTNLYNGYIISNGSTYNLKNTIDNGAAVLSTIRTNNNWRNDKKLTEDGE